MWDIIQYPFFRNAVVGVLLISIASAIVGTYIVSRRMVAVSGGVTHACFGGLGLGYYLGLNPILTAAVFAIGSALGVDWMARSQRVREDSAIAVVWALGMATGVFFVFITPGYVPELNTFLFGNVLTISCTDLVVFAVYTALLTLFMTLFFRRVVACAFDADFAKVVHMPVRFITTAMTIFVALCIVLTIRLVGIMLLMSMLAMPQIISEIFFHRFKAIMICSIVVSALCCLTGLLLSAVIDVPCSALIVMVMVVCYLIARIVRAMKWRRVVPMLVVAALSMAALQGCSLKKNTAASRNYSAFITRYNIYFNGDEHYKTELAKMEKDYVDDYSRTLFMHPAEAYNDDKAPQPSADFKRSIEKAQKAIQLRSIKKRPARKPGKGSDPEYKKWLQREEYNPFLHNAWMMMARSQYMNGDFLGSAATFYYIAKHFWWLPTTVTEAKLWQARCYCAIDWLFEAESILTKIKPEEIEGNSTLENLYYFSYADFYVRSHEYEKAIPMLEKAIKYAKGAQKTRLTFLLGQLYTDTGQREQAYNTFKKVGSMSSASYRTKFNARIKESEVYQGDDIRKEVKALQAMTRYGSNREYLDQIYYAIGNLYLSRGDTTQAIDNYRLAMDKSTRNGIDKARAAIALGQLYFDRHDYDKAQPCYAEAVPQLPTTFPDYQTLKRRSDVLDELVVYSQNVTLQDSLLKLSYMTPEQQREVVDKIITDLKKREKEEAEALAREKYLEEQAAAGTGLQQGSTSAPATFALNTDKSWYFYNEATRNAGRTEFQKRWGSRRLEDDWRRRNKASFSAPGDEVDETDVDEPDETTADDDTPSSADREAAEHATDPHYPEYYLRQIPTTDAERATANDVIQEGLYNMGVILKDKLDDSGAAEYEFNELLRRYPDNVYRLDTYYNMYLMYARSGDMAKAEKFRQLIMTEFPDSRQGEALADPQYMEKLLQMPQMEQGLYDEIYAAYLDNNNRRVHEIYDIMRRDYPMSRIMPKFMFIEALSYVSENNPEQFDKILRELVSLYPDADVSPLASSYIQLLSEGRKFNSTGGNVRGMKWSTRLTNDPNATTDDGTAAEFDFESDGPQLLVFAYRADRVNANQLLFEVARHNFAAYNVKDFDLQSMRFGQLGLLVVSGFDSRREVQDYRSQLEKGVAFHIPPGVVPFEISKTNFDLLLGQGRSLEEYFEAVGDKRLEQIHTATLPAEEYPSAKEMYDRTTQPEEPSAPAKSDKSDQSDESDKSDKSDKSDEPTLTPPAAPAPAPAAPTAEPAPKSEVEEDEEDPFDIPIPPLPATKPPVAPRVK
ncbi:MAG: metal ABC transporter permease [Bacteroides sp.]|nr:metal ABC transporter permease [Bacteroides sp.]MCM1413575.1 metal ABC transporter permease [Bacteroides sp.]MCM1471129.1 metal ABC transporter permease [Bacteroides sp.]